MSLCLLEAVKSFRIRHRPTDKMMLRIGRHSGKNVSPAKIKKNPAKIRIGARIRFFPNANFHSGKVQSLCSITASCLDQCDQMLE